MGPVDALKDDAASALVDRLEEQGDRQNGSGHGGSQQGLCGRKGRVDHLPSDHVVQGLAHCLVPVPLKNNVTVVGSAGRSN